VRASTEAERPSKTLGPRVSARGGSEADSLSQRANDFATTRTKRKQSTDQQVDRHRGIGFLELGR